MFHPRVGYPPWAFTAPPPEYSLSAQPLVTAENFAVVRLEDLHEVARLRADLIAVYQSVNSQELSTQPRDRSGLAMTSVALEACFLADSNASSAFTKFQTGGGRFLRGVQPLSERRAFTGPDPPTLA